MLGNWKCKSPNLILLADRAQTILKGLSKRGKVSVEHVPREQNAMADIVSNLAVRYKTEVVHEDLKDPFDVSYFKARFGSTS